MKITAKQIAKDMGISTATVSLAMNHKPGVKEETRQKVLEYLRKLESSYYNEQLSGKCIKMLIYIQEDKLYRNTVQAYSQRDYARFCRVVQEHDLELKTYYVYNEKEINKILEESNYDNETLGIILELDEAPPNLVKELCECDIPIIVFDADLPIGKSNFRVINFHNQQGIAIAIDYLLSKNLKNIVYFRNSETIFNFDRRRIAFYQYKQKNESNEIQLSMMPMGYRIEEIEQNVRKYIEEQQTLPDAILSENFTMSVGILRALDKMKIKVPEQISLIGIDAISEYDYFSRDITCLEVPINERNSISIKEMLEKKKNKDSIPLEVLLGMKLHIGDTVK